jgi:hypothetical protein
MVHVLGEKLFRYFVSINISYVPQTAKIGRATPHEKIKSTAIGLRALESHLRTTAAKYKHNQF